MLFTQDLKKTGFPPELPTEKYILWNIYASGTHLQPLSNFYKLNFVVYSFGKETEEKWTNNEG